MTRLFTASNKKVFSIGIGTYNIASRENPDTAELLKTTGYKNVEPVYGNEDDEIAGLLHSLSHGQNYIDTAGMYGGGYTNEVVGKALADSQILRDDLFIAHNVWKSDFGNVRTMIETHLSKLGIEYFDVAGPHSPHTEGWNTPTWQTTMKDFASLREEGLVRGVSVSNFSVNQIKEAEQLLGFRVTTAQAGYSVLDQGQAKQELREYCNKNSIQFVGYWALNGGVLRDSAVLKIASAHNVSAAQVGLAFVLNEDVLPIVKSINPGHINDNLAAIELELTQAEVEALRGVGQ